jgi:small subunit ribosomal protein S6
MTKNKKIYETTFIVNAGLDDPQIDAVIEKVKDLITKNEGEILELVKWGRKRFAYPIKKKNNGFYVICEFSSPGSLVNRLERHFMLDENIIRYLTVVLDKNAIKGRISGVDLMKQTISTPMPGGTPVVEAPAEEDSGGHASHPRTQ